MTASEAPLAGVSVDREVMPLRLENNFGKSLDCI